MIMRLVRLAYTRPVLARTDTEPSGPVLDAMAAFC